MSDIGTVVQTLEDRRDETRLRIAEACIDNKDASKYLTEYRAIVESITALKNADEAYSGNSEPAYQAA